MRRPFRQWRAAGQGGFTLIELVLVLFVIGMVVAVAFPRFRNLGGGDLDSETRTLIGHIQGLYSEATFTRRTHRLVFDLDGNRYWAEVANVTETEGETGPEKTQAFAPVVTTFLRPVRLPRDVELTDVTAAGRGKRSDGTAYTYFYPLGRTDFTVIHLSQGDDRQVTLRVNPVSGRVTLDDGYREEFTG
ncbi:MAG: type II secretion system protein [Nitrospirae bacterium]|nr:type II secretion system protein [Nitrospirota bacterium]